MRLTRLCLALFLPAFLAGCSLLRLGRVEKNPVAGDAAMAAAYANLSTEHKMLKQELTLAHKEGDALRLALERAPGAPSTDVAARLKETTRELAALRASYTQLQAERATGNPAAAGDAARLREVEDKLAASLRNFVQLQEENGRLRSELDRARRENSTLGDQLKAAAAQDEQAKHDLEMLNIELLAQKQARVQAERTTEAVRAQLGVVLARGSGGGAGDLAAAREAAAASTAALQISRPPTAGAPPTAELRLDTERLRRAGEKPPANRPPIPRPRVYVVKAGDTLEKIATTYYGAPDRWHTLYSANTALLADGQGLRAGMELQLP